MLRSERPGSAADARLDGGWPSISPISSAAVQPVQPVPPIHVEVPTGRQQSQMNCFATLQVGQVGRGLGRRCELARLGTPCGFWDAFRTWSRSWAIGPPAKPAGQRIGNSVPLGCRLPPRNTSRKGERTITT